MTPSRAGRTGEKRGFLVYPGGAARVVPVDTQDGLPEGLPWEETPSNNEGENGPAGEGGEPAAPQEEVP